MLNAYPDSVGGRLSGMVDLLKRPEFEKTFALFYILPTFFNSDLDRGFSVIDYDHNPELVTEDDLRDLSRLEIMFKLDLVLNHLSVRSPQFQDLLHLGDRSEYRDFFIDWNDFWADQGEPTAEGYLMPKPEHLEKLFMRKPGIPILKVRFPDGSERPYWNTFYQEIRYSEVSPDDLREIEGLSESDVELLVDMVNARLRQKPDLGTMDLNGYASLKDKVVSIVERKRDYLGQMDLNARSEKVWHFYDETLRKLRDYGARIIRLDAFAYLHKAPGEPNFFNRPGTWDYLDRLRGIAEKYDLIVFPEVHAEYGSGLHEEVAGKGFPIYDFFFPGLVIDALERGTNEHLLEWIGEIQDKGLKTINMLGCHDGIPVLDLNGKEVDGIRRPGLLAEEHIEAVMSRIMERGGRVKSLYGPDGRKISYYQVNATFFSALGEDERKLLLARAIQLFMPGIPQVWYLDLFAGSNDYAAADRGGTGGHKEINRTNLTLEQAEEALRKTLVQDQLDLIRLRNTSEAFLGELSVERADSHTLKLTWSHQGHRATLEANLRDHSFCVEHETPSGLESRRQYL
ncbi:alpha-amylase family protein [Imhoffiella purpurea]|uniref:Sucrose phosphorylase n=1 Tax=Imhoffiella purpurea TaxID=1249627 RepID=W9V284_9GAMM|nr:glycosidase [Imhoffiella purpurea]EXJ11056.1 Sucrose phosphorylase [Imhoffiella purpurea]